MLYMERIGPDLWRLLGIHARSQGPLPTVVGNYSVVAQIATMLATREANPSSTLTPLFDAKAEGPEEPESS